MMKYLLLFLLCTSLTIAQNVGVGTATPDPTAKLDVNSSNSGFLPPRLTTAQRNAIAGPARGLMIYNLDTDCMEYWNGTEWISTCATTAPCSKPPASTPGSNSPVCQGYTLNLTATPVVGATYVWSGPGGYSSTTQNPSIATTTLAHDGTYTLRTWLLGCYSDANTIDVTIVPNQWVQRASFPAVKRSYPMSAALNDLVYIGGGNNNTSSCGTTHTDFWAYNPATDSWAARQNIPATFGFDGGSFSVNGRIFAIGGLNNLCQGGFSSVNSYNPGTNTWTTSATAFPGGVRGSTWQSGPAYASGTKALFGLGRNSGCAYRDVNDLYVYDQALDSWTNVTAAYPGGKREMAFSFVINDTVYIGSGAYFNPDCSGNWVTLNTVYAYDLSAGTCTAVAAYPGAFTYPAMSCTLNGKGYVLDGNRYLWTYDPAANSWTRLACPCPRSGKLQAAAGKIYLVDAMDSLENWEFTP